VRIVLDAGGVTAVAGDVERQARLREEVDMPLVVPSVVLTEATTGDHRRDFHENRLVRVCEVVSVDEKLARRAAQLRAAVKRRVSAVDAVVVATAEWVGGGLVLTCDRRDIEALSHRADRAPVLVESV
jgi:predicted nucleic acid-binding protein